MRAGQLLILYGEMEQLCTASMIRSFRVRIAEKCRRSDDDERDPDREYELKRDEGNVSE